MSTYISLDVLVLEVEGVLPNVDTNDGDQAEERVLVGSGRNLETLSLRVVPEPSPAGSLDTQGSGVELLLEVIERAESLLDGLLERTVLEDTTVTLVSGSRGGEVLPEQRVVDVTCE
jgi:hypothetical protein